MDILKRRLHSQRLVGPIPATAAEVVHWMGAVQAQDYAAARWAIAQRAPGLSGADVDGALASGEVIRTHILRPTWHIVHAADVRWMLALTAPRVKALSAYYHRRAGIDAAAILAASRVFASALAGRKLTRAELGEALVTAGLPARDTVALAHLVLGAELDGVICSGGLRGRQHTYALLDERLPGPRVLDRDAAAAELAGRYFASHGPATARDFAWWSGLPMADARIATSTARPALASMEHENRTYWFVDGPAAREPSSPAGHLLSNFDEYTVGYTERSLLAKVDASWGQPFAILGNVVVIDGRIVGAWQRTIGATTVHVTTTMVTPAPTRGRAVIRTAAQRYAAFLGLTLELDGKATVPRRGARRGR